MVHAMPPRILLGLLASSAVQPGRATNASGAQEAVVGSMALVSGGGGSELALQEATATLRDLAVSETASNATVSATAAIGPLVVLLRGGCGRQQEKAARALANFAGSYGAEAQLAIAHAGAIDPLVALARDGGAEGGEAAASALRNLASHKSNQLAIVQAGGIAPLVTLARGGSAKAAGALCNLAFNAENDVALVNAGVIGPLVELVRGGDTAAQAASATALGNLAHINPYNQVVIARAGAIKALVELAISGSAAAQKEAASALHNLGANADNKVTIVRAEQAAAKRLLEANDTSFSSAGGGRASAGYGAKEASIALLTVIKEASVALLTVIARVLLTAMAALGARQCYLLLWTGRTGRSEGANQQPTGRTPSQLRAKATAKEAANRRKRRQVNEAPATRVATQAMATAVKTGAAADKENLKADAKPKALEMMEAARAEIEDEVNAAKAAAMAATAAAMADASRLSAKLTTIRENAMCCMCLSEPKTHLLLPCGHKCACEDCVTLLSAPGAICPLCRVRVASTVRVYES